MTFKEKVLAFSLSVTTWMMVLFCCGMMLGALIATVGIFWGLQAR